LHASSGAYTLSKETCDFIEWYESYMFHHIDLSIQYVEVKEIIGFDPDSGDKNILHESRFSFLLRKVILLHICLDNRDCVSIGIVTNVDKKDSIEGKLFGYLSFGVLVKELVFPCDIFS